MNTTTATKPVKYLKQDADGNLYAIPENEVFPFTMAVESIQNADFGSNEWHQLTDDLFQNYSPYRKE